MSMNFLNFLECNPSTFLFVDPGINTTGVAIYRVGVQGKELWKDLLLSDHIDVEKEDMGTMDRVHRMVDTLILDISAHQVQHILIEEPPSTIYRPQGKGDIDNIIARAQSVFKTIAMAYALAGVLIGKKTVRKIHMFAPVEWEPHHTHRKNMTMKEWSLWHANLVRNKHFPGRKPLTTKKEENEADAINQGYFLLQKLSTGKKDWNP